MKVLIAPCSFKGSLSARRAAQAMISGFALARPDFELQTHPIADGGEGTLELIVEHLGGTIRPVATIDPLGRPIQAAFGLINDGATAVVESARALGLHLLSKTERNAGKTTSRGLGRILRHILELGIEEIWLGLGGTGTVDCGAGMLAELGAQLLDGAGAPITCNGLGLRHLESMDLTGARRRTTSWRCKVLNDVASPLLGTKGARLYMPQKGANAQTCERLESNLANFCRIALRVSGIDIANLEGAGAAGGLGGALALLGAELVSGSDFFMRNTDLVAKMVQCDWVISGEGRVDAQTAQGKGLAALAHLAKRHRKPLIALCGSRGEGWQSLRDKGLTAVFSLAPGPMNTETAMAHAYDLLYASSRELGALLGALWDMPPPRK